MTPYTHVGRREATGHYAVSAAAERRPGKLHALTLRRASDGARFRGKLDPARRRDDRESYVGLCGVVVPMTSDDEFCPAPQVREATPKDRITCKRCRAKLAD